MATRRKSGPEKGPAKWQATPYVRPPNKKLRPVADPGATSQRQDHTGHGCTWDPKGYKGNVHGSGGIHHAKVTTHLTGGASKRSYATKEQLATPKDPLTARREHYDKAVAKERAAAGGPSVANTRVCPKCKAVVKGNAWHLNKHMARHK
jgi:hypothetical protein